MNFEINENMSSFTRDDMKFQKNKNKQQRLKTTKKSMNQLSKFKDIMIEDYESQKPSSDQ